MRILDTLAGGLAAVLVLSGCASDREWGSCAVAGGIIGAAAGAMLGSQLEPRRSGYYWYDGRCYWRGRDGNYYPTKRYHCG